MLKRNRWSKRTLSLVLVACVALFGSIMPGGSVTGSPLPLATAPTMGAAQNFAVLGASTVTNTGPTTITGDLGLYAGTSITGLGSITLTGTVHQTDLAAQQAQDAVTAAYTNLAAQTCDTTFLVPTDLGGQTLTPGVYCFSSSAAVTGVLTLNAQGNANAVWVFKIGSTLITASGSSVVFINSIGSPCNVFWQVTSSATLGTGSSFVGSILALASVGLNTSASLSGRALARTGAVTLDSNTISAAPCLAAPTPTATATATASATATATATATTTRTATPTATSLPSTPTATAAPPTATQVPPTATSVPESPTETPVPEAPTATAVPATPTATVAPETPMPTPTEESTAQATATATAELERTATTVVTPTTLPRTGDTPYDRIMAWLALAGAGGTLLGLSLRRKSH